MKETVIIMIPVYNDFASLEIKKEIGDSIGIADTYNSIGIVYDKLGNYSDALLNQFNALRIHSKLDNKKGLAATYNNLGGLYLYHLELDESRKYYQLCIDISTKIGLEEGMIVCCIIYYLKVASCNILVCDKRSKSNETCISILESKILH